MTEKDAKPTVGFIGLGLMGSRMAGRLLDAGYSLTVYNRNRDRMERLAQYGARAVSTPREAAAEAEVVMISVADDAALRAVMCSPDGALQGARPGSIFVDMSTVSPGVARAMAQEAKGRGVSMIDAPVAGTIGPAAEGTLVVLAGGNAETLDRVRPLLQVLSKEIFHLGPSGSGATMKLVVNAILGVELQGLAEALTLGEQAGLEKGRLIDVLGQMAVVAPAIKGKLENARRDEYPVAFPAQLMHKDFRLVTQLAAELCVPMPATAAAEQISAVEAARGVEEDYSAVIKLMEQLAQGKG